MRIESNGVTDGPPIDAAAEREVARLRQAAKDFESVMLETLLKEMGATSASAEGGSVGSDGFADIGAQALSGAIASSGGFGIAEALVQAMEAQVRAYAAGRDEGGPIG